MEWLKGVEETQHESPASHLIRYLAAHTEYEAAILITSGQYLLYARVGKNELAPKGVSAQTLRQAFLGEPVDSGWLPPGVVRCGSGPGGPFFVKCIPAGVHDLLLVLPESTRPTQITLPLPPLVFAGNHMTYYVWALQTNGCEPTAFLYHAPFPNVYQDGRICFGQNHPPAVSEKTLESTWKLFLSSPFNSDLCGNKSHAFPHNVQVQLLDVATDPHATTYPVHDLIRYHLQRSYAFDGQRDRCTLEDVTNSLLLQKGQE